MCPLSPVTIDPRRTVRDPLPEIRRFDTDRNLNYVADIRGDLIFEGFPAPTTALALDPKRTTRTEDVSLKPARPSAANRTNEDPKAIVSVENSESDLVVVRPPKRGQGMKVV